jgi:hypothetical protein
MTDERRRHHRFVHPLEGNWWGSSGSTRCRIGDISESGCFVQCLMPPSPGEETKISLFVSQGELTLPGTIVYAERGIGFGMKFNELSRDEAAKLEELLAELAAGGD